MKTRQTKGGTLGIAAVLILVIVLIGFAAFILYKKEGGFREIQTAAGCGNRNVAHNAQVYSVGGLNNTNPIDKAISEVVRQRGRVSLADCPVLESWELLAAMNAAADGNPGGIANVRALLTRIHGLNGQGGPGLRPSIYYQLKRNLENFGTTTRGRALFESVARRNPTGMINDPTSQPMTQTHYRVGYSENRTYIDLGNPAVLEQQRPYTTAGYFTGERQPWPNNMIVPHGGRNWLGAYRAMVVGAPADNLTVAGPALPRDQTHNVSPAAANPTQPVPTAVLPPNTFVNAGTVPDPHGGPATETAAAVACAVMVEPFALKKGFITYDNSPMPVGLRDLRVAYRINLTPEMFAMGVPTHYAAEGPAGYQFGWPGSESILGYYVSPNRSENPQDCPEVFIDLGWGSMPALSKADGTPITSKQEALQVITPDGAPVVICTDPLGETVPCTHLTTERPGPSAPPGNRFFFGDFWPADTYHCVDNPASDIARINCAQEIGQNIVSDLYSRYEDPSVPAELFVTYANRITTGSKVWFEANAAGDPINIRKGFSCPYRGAGRDHYIDYFKGVSHDTTYSGPNHFEISNENGTNPYTLMAQIQDGPFEVIRGGRPDIESVVNRTLVTGRAVTLGNTYPAVTGVLDQGYDGGVAIAAARPPLDVLQDVFRQRIREIDPNATNAHCDAVVQSMTGMKKYWIDKRNGSSVEAYPTRTPWSDGTEDVDGTPTTVWCTYAFDPNPRYQQNIHDRLFLSQVGGTGMAREQLTFVPCSGANLLLLAVKARSSFWTGKPVKLTPIGRPPRPPVAVPIHFSQRN